MTEARGQSRSDGAYYSALVTARARRSDAPARAAPGPPAPPAASPAPAAGPQHRHLRGRDGAVADRRPGPRDRAASFFATGGRVSAFTLAFQIPNLFRNLFSQAALGAAFVPVFTELLQEGKQARGVPARLDAVLADPRSRSAR